MKKCDVMSTEFRVDNLGYRLNDQPLDGWLEPGAIDLPPLRAAYLYWQGLCLGTDAPARAQIDPADMRLSLPYLMLVDVRDQGRTFFFRLAGTNVAQGVDPTGRVLNDAVPDGAYRDHILSLYEQGCRGPSALYTVSRYGDVRISGAESPTVARLFLPLDMQQGVAGKLLVGQMWHRRRYQSDSLWNLNPSDITVPTFARLPAAI